MFQLKHFKKNKLILIIYLTKSNSGIIESTLKWKVHWHFFKFFGHIAWHVGFSSPLFSHLVVSESLCPQRHSRLPCPPLSPRVCSNLCPLRQWCHPIILSLLPHSPPTLNLSQASVFSNELALCIRCQSIGVSASASVLPMNSQDWFSLALTGLISLLSKGLSRVFSSTTVWKHQCPLHWKYSLNHWTISEVWRCINIAGCC